MKVLFSLMLLLSFAGILISGYPPFAAAQNSPYDRIGDIQASGQRNWAAINQEVKDRGNDVGELRSHDVKDLWAAIQAIEIRDAQEDGIWITVKVFFAVTSVFAGSGLVLTYRNIKGK